ncbi:unnamed protein product [Prorocentrum cordatum]|uniref:Uncharacterized protein n=1 Tax=Prorocentrum cordatum TaxID=2364126 RepID=A0ABN9R3K2_9DINO|nr:unnamed protein product [Polarella glacialis]
MGADKPVDHGLGVIATQEALRQNPHFVEHQKSVEALIQQVTEANVTESGMDESDVLSLESQDAADTTEDPAELLEADTTEDPAQLLSADDTTEAPAELLEADTTEDPDPAQLLRADGTTEAPAELLEADTTEAPTELVHADTTEEPAELIRADTTEEDGAHAEESEGKDKPAMSKGEESKGKDKKTKMIEGDDADVEESGSEGKTAMKAKKTKMIKAAAGELFPASALSPPLLKSTAKAAVKAKKTKIIKDEQAATAPSSAELAAAQSVVARKLIAITSALVKVTSIINFAQNISSQAKIMIGEDLYLGADITNSLHVSGGLNKALFKHGSDMIPNQNRLNLKINEIEAELQAFKVHYNDIMPAGRNVPLGA